MIRLFAFIFTVWALYKAASAVPVGFSLTGVVSVLTFVVLAGWIVWRVLTS